MFFVGIENFARNLAIFFALIQIFSSFCLASEELSGEILKENLKSLTINGETCVSECQVDKAKLFWCYTDVSTGSWDYCDNFENNQIDGEYKDDKDKDGNLSEIRNRRDININLGKKKKKKKSKWNSGCSIHPGFITTGLYLTALLLITTLFY